MLEWCKRFLRWKKDNFVSALMRRVKADPEFIMTFRTIVHRQANLRNLDTSKLMWCNKTETSGIINIYRPCPVLGPLNHSGFAPLNGATATSHTQANYIRSPSPFTLFTAVKQLSHKISRFKPNALYVRQTAFGCGRNPKYSMTFTSNLLLLFKQ